MTALQIFSIAVCAAVLVLVLRRTRPESATVLSMAAGALALLCALPTLGTVLSGLTDMARLGGVADEYLSQLLKVAGVALLMDFSAQTCLDAGEEGLALKTELAGRVMLISLALPFMKALLQQILSIAP